MKKCYYPIKFRWKIVQQIDAGILSKQQACEKHSITIILIRKWRKQYFQRRLLPYYNPKPMKAKQDQTEKIKALEMQLKQAQKALEDEKLKSRAYEIMIDIAENELNIPVRKKPGPKRSHK